MVLPNSWLIASTVMAQQTPAHSLPLFSDPVVVVLSQVMTPATVTMAPNVSASYQEYQDTLLSVQGAWSWITDAIV